MASAGPFSLHNAQLAPHNGSYDASTHGDVPSAADSSAEKPAPGSSHRVTLPGRITHRRSELGLCTEELAQRAGIDPTYLEYFERTADARLSSER